MLFSIPFKNSNQKYSIFQTMCINIGIKRASPHTVERHWTHTMNRKCADSSKQCIFIVCEAHGFFHGLCRKPCNATLNKRYEEKKTHTHTHDCIETEWSACTHTATNNYDWFSFVRSGTIPSLYKIVHAIYVCLFTYVDVIQTTFSRAHNSYIAVWVFLPISQTKKKFTHPEKKFNTYFDLQSEYN